MTTMSLKAKDLKYRTRIVVPDGEEHAGMRALVVEVFQARDGSSAHFLAWVLPLDHREYDDVGVMEMRAAADLTFRTWSIAEARVEAERILDAGLSDNFAEETLVTLDALEEGELEEGGQQP